MSTLLFGSQFSPYVRRVRLLLEGLDYEYRAINLYENPGKAELLKYTPILRIPLLIHQGEVLWDSFLIAQWAREKKGLGTYTLEEQKGLVLVDELLDSGMNIFQLRKYGNSMAFDNPFGQKHVDRVERLLQLFDQQLLAGPRLTRDQSHYLFCTLDWFEFRQVASFLNCKALVKFWQSHQDLPFSPRS